MSDELRDDLPASIDSLYDAGSSEDGAINIADSVFASIIENYTLEIPEVVRFSSNSVVGSLAKIIGKTSSNDPIDSPVRRNAPRDQPNLESGRMYRRWRRRVVAGADPPGHRAQAQVYG